MNGFVSLLKVYCEWVSLLLETGTASHLLPPPPATPLPNPDQTLSQLSEKKRRVPTTLLPTWYKVSCGFLPLIRS